MNEKFLLLLGPSGCGKSTIINLLRRQCKHYSYISPYVTRPLRPGEGDKIFLSVPDMDRLQAEDEFLVVNEIYGIRYATPRRPILTAFATQQFPILDWPVSRIDIMINAFTRDRLHVVYVAPPSLEVLERRLQLDDRDKDGARYRAGVEEFVMYQEGKFDGIINLKVTSTQDQIPQLAEQIHASYLAVAGPI